MAALISSEPALKEVALKMAADGNDAFTRLLTYLPEPL